MTSTDRREIVSGPSREELFDALRLSNEMRRVTFTVEAVSSSPNPRFKIHGESFQATVVEIGVHLITGHSWDLKICDEKRTIGWAHMGVRFDTDTRKGWIERN